MIVVTAPTGQIGSHLLARLLKGSDPLRLVVRDPSKLSDAARERAQIVQGSHSDPQVIAEALAGADSLFWLPPGDTTAANAEDGYVGFSQAAAAALKGGSVRRVVAVSALGRGWPTYAGQVTATLQADDLLAATGVAYRALACGSLMENVLRQLAPIATQGVFYGPGDGGRRGTAVAVGDVAAIAHDLLSDRSWQGVEEVPLKGPEAISGDEMAAAMSRALGRPVRYRQTSLKDLRATMVARGTSPGMADATVALIKAKGEGLDDTVAGPTPALTPTTFAQWCGTVLRAAVGT